MSEHSVEVRKILWSEAVPPMRLLSTFWRAFALGPMAAAFAFVVIAFLLGRVLDATWRYLDYGVVVAGSTENVDEPRTEIDTFAALDSSGYREWRRAMIARRGAAAPQPIAPEALVEARKLIAERVERGLVAIDADPQLSKAERAAQRGELRRKADVLRFRLAGKPVNPYPAIDPGEAVEHVLSKDPDVTVALRTTEVTSLRNLLQRVQAEAEYRAAAPRGPFAALVDYEMRCGAAAVRGAVSGRWGLQSPAQSPEPALLGSVVSAGQGLLWLAVERPWYALLYLVLLLVVASPFAGMICRLAAIQIAREEQGENRKALAFMRARIWALVGAPLFCIAMCLGIGLLLWIGGLFGAIPYIGPLLSGAAFFLALLGGLAIAFFLLALLCGFPLMWPTIAVEGSDAFDALQRGCNYTLVRPGLTALCHVTLLLTGAISLLAIRLVAMVVLKAAHCATGAGMGAFRSSAESDTIGPLNAMWWMPDWQDLSLLPATSGAPFWGVLNYGPLSGAESIGAFLIGMWVYVVVGLVAAFVVAFAFAGLTETYFVLRRAVDGADYSEIYFEQEPDQFAVTEAAGETPAVDKPSLGTALPVVNPP